MAREYACLTHARFRPQAAYAQATPTFTLGGKPTNSCADSPATLTNGAPTSSHACHSAAHKSTFRNWTLPNSPKRKRAWSHATNSKHGFTRTTLGAEHADSSHLRTRQPATDSFDSPKRKAQTTCDSWRAAGLPPYDAKQKWGGLTPGAHSDGQT